MEVGLEQLIDDFYAEVGKRLRTTRNRKGMTQSELASAVDLARSSITNLEAGRQRIPLHLLALLADVLDTSVGELLPNRLFLSEGNPARNITAHLANVPDRMRDFVETTMAKAVLARKEAT